jgi:DNA-binding LytR/AlgR family response regulator
MNCIIVDDDDFSRKDLEYKIDQTVLLDLVGSYSNAIDAVQAVVTNNVDVVFLDVIMPEMSGLEFIKSLNILKPEIILISGDPQNAVKGFDYDVTDFLVKPIPYDRFLMAVTKAARNNKKKGVRVVPHESNVFIKVGTKLVCLELKNVHYIEALADYITIYTEKKKYTILSTMKRMEEILSGMDFFRVHNSYIVNIRQITSIENQTLMVGQTQIPVSRTRWKNLLDRIKLI